MTSQSIFFVYSSPLATYRINRRTTNVNKYTDENKNMKNRCLKKELKPYENVKICKVASNNKTNIVHRAMQYTRILDRLEINIDRAVRPCSHRYSGSGCLCRKGLSCLASSPALVSGPNSISRVFNGPKTTSMLYLANTKCT